MSNYPRVEPDTYYVDGMPVPAALFQAVDTAQNEGVNGDTGGSYALTSNLVVGGAGMWCAGPWEMDSGGVTCSEAAPLVHQDGDFVQLASGAGRTSRFVSTSLWPAWDASYATAGPGGGFSQLPRFVTNENLSDSLGTSTTYVGGGRIVCPLRVHDGATLAQVTLEFFVPVAHASVPAAVPRMRVIQVDVLGNETALSTQYGQTGWVGDGFVAIATPGSGAAWHNTGNPQSFTYTCDAGVVIDVSKYTYFVEIQDERGATPGTDVCRGNTFVSVVAEFTHIHDWRWQ